MVLLDKFRSLSELCTMEEEIDADDVVNIVDASSVPDPQTERDLVNEGVGSVGARAPSPFFLTNPGRHFLNQFQCLFCKKENVFFFDFFIFDCND